MFALFNLLGLVCYMCFCEGLFVGPPELPICCLLLTSVEMALLGRASFYLVHYCNFDLYAL